MIDCYNVVNNLTEVTATDSEVTATEMAATEVTVTDLDVTVLWSESDSNLKILVSGIIISQQYDNNNYYCIHAVLSSVIVVIAVIILSVFALLVGNRIKRARKNVNKTDADAAVYEEVVDVSSIDPKPRDTEFKYNVNSCYSLEPQDPVYAEVENIIKMKRNDVYGFMQEQENMTSLPEQIFHPSSTLNCVPAVTHTELSAIPSDSERKQP